MLSPLRVFWNALVPWRRRRRYYFLRVLAALREQEVDPATLPDVFSVTPAAFADYLAGRAVPRLFVQSLAMLAYKVPPPRSWSVYGPLVSLVAALAVAGAGWQLLH